MATPRRLPLDDTYPSQPLTIHEAVTYTSTRKPPPRALSANYNDNFTAFPWPDPPPPSPFRPGVRRSPYPPPHTAAARAPPPLPPHLTLPSHKLPRPMRLRPLTRDMLKQMTLQQARIYLAIKLYSDHYFSLSIDGWLRWERAYVDGNAIARDFAGDSELRLTETWSVGCRGIYGELDNGGDHRQAAAILLMQTSNLDGAEEEEEEVTVAEKIQHENRKRIAMWIATEKLSGRRS